MIYIIIYILMKNDALPYIYDPNIHLHPLLTFLSRPLSWSELLDPVEQVDAASREEVAVAEAGRATSTNIRPALIKGP